VMMDITKWVLTFVVVCVTIVTLCITYMCFTIGNIFWELKVLQSKHTNMMLRTELCLKRGNHDRYKESRIEDPSSEN